MEETWDDDYDSTNNQASIYKDPGRSFTAGRGFTPFFGQEDTSNGPNNDGQGFGSGKNFDNHRGGRGQNRGRGDGRGGRGGRGGRNFNRDDENDNGGRRYNDNENEGGGYNRGDNENEFRGRGGGRGGRGGRGGGGGGGDRGDEPIKPRENYVPPEPTNNENELFGSGITSGRNFDNYEKSEVQVTGDNPPNAIKSFEASGLMQFVLDNVKKSKYIKPTPIQKRGIPIIMAGRDLMGCAQTGSGKTAAFLLPIIHTLLSNKNELSSSLGQAKPSVVILAPTRELAIQIHDVARKFAFSSVLKICLAYGGASVQHQSNQMRNGCHILVGTCGRIVDFLDRDIISLECVKFFVLDEADRMLDLGFMSSIEKIMMNPNMPSKENRQTAMFSATFPKAIQELASKYLNNYIFVTIGIIGGACTDVEQKFFQVSKFEKKDKLKEILQTDEPEQTLIFVETKRSADFIAVYVSEYLKYRATSIHGDRLQRERESALDEFKSGRCHILVATAVAARGLDIDGVAHVINFDLPSNVDEYVHRIGRTGRVGNRGRATSFYDSSVDQPVAAELVKILQQANQSIPDFLEAESCGGGFTSHRQNTFGGKDIRRFEALSVQEAVDNNIPDEEQW